MRKIKTKQFCSSPSHTFLPPSTVFNIPQVPSELPWLPSHLGSFPVLLLFFKFSLIRISSNLHRVGLQKGLSWYESLKFPSSALPIYRTLLLGRRTGNHQLTATERVSKLPEVKWAESMINQPSLRLYNTGWKQKKNINKYCMQHTGQ